MARGRRAQRSRPVTVREVAKEAGVSIASVSRVINGQSNVAEPTRSAVLKAVKSLNYVPHGGGRALASRRTHLVGVILPDIYGEYFSEIVRGVDLAARAQGLHLLVASSHGAAEEARALLRQMHGRVDGLILMSPYLSAEALSAIVPADAQVTLVNSGDGGGRFDSISVDNAAGARLAAAHLLAQGRQRIALIEGPAGNIDARERREGYLAVIRQAGRTPIFYPGDFSEAAGHAAGQTIAAELAKGAAAPDAVFAANDMMALGCMAALNAAGRSIPEDVALVGFDDIPLARFVNPALTTVSADIAEIGRQALERLARCMESGGTGARSLTVTPHLTVRRSCGGARETAEASRKRRRQGGFREAENV